MKMSKKELYFAAVKSDLKVFLEHSFGTIYPEKEFMDNWHIDAIIHSLEMCIEGKRPRLVINLPPRHLKSFIVSVVLPAFILGRDPTAKIICISYSDELAKTLSRDFRRIIESEWYLRLFPKVRASKMTENEFVADKGGVRYATSVGGTLTGRGGDFIIIDDPIKPEDTHSDKVRQSTNEWYKSTLLSRLDDKEKSVLILVMQRLHVNDLTGFVEGCGGFHKLSFPAIAIKDENISVSDKENYFRQEGEPLHEEREGADILDRIRDEVGSYNFAAQYQQQPECPQGSMFKRRWINIIDQPPAIDQNGYLIVSIDTAVSMSETADYTAITLTHSNKDGHFVLYSERGRWDYETLKEKTWKYVHKYGKEVYFIVESANVGISLLMALKKARFRWFSYKPKYDKATRGAYVVPVFNSGRLFVVNQAGQNDWVESFINEIVSFPNGRFDDQVDSLVQTLLWAEQRVNPGGGIYLC